MTEYQIDRALGCTPCICGDLQSWHRECYANKTKEQVDAAYRRVYAKARRYLRRIRVTAIDAARKGDANDELEHARRELAVRGVPRK